MSESHEAWGWISPNGKPQDVVFTSPDEAIAGMRERMGWDEFSLQKVLDLGFKLALLRVTIEPLAALAAVTAQGAGLVTGVAPGEVSDVG